MPFQKTRITIRTVHYTIIDNQNTVYVFFSIILSATYFTSHRNECVVTNDCHYLYVDTNSINCIFGSHTVNNNCSRYLYFELYYRLIFLRDKPEKIQKKFNFAKDLHNSKKKKKL